MIPDDTKNGPFMRTGAREKAAALTAADTLTDDDIAEQVGISRATLARWRRVPEFQVRVQEHVAALRQAIMTQGIADKCRRIVRLNRDWLQLQIVIDKRQAEAIEYQRQHGREEYPGSTTGLIVKTFRGVGNGADFRLVEEFSIDTGTLAELRALELQAAKECGQWMERHEHSLDEEISGLLALLLGADEEPASLEI